MSDLPPGFVLDKKPAASPGGLPPGFVLDKPKESPQQESGGLFERLWSGMAGKEGKQAASGVTSGAANLATSLWDSLLAGKQGVSRFAAEEKGTQLAPPQAQAIFDESGSVQDSRSQFVARNPQTGKMAVYQRSPAVETSRLGGAMDVMGTVIGAGAQPESFGAAVKPSAMTPARQLAQDYREAKVPMNLPAVSGSDAVSRTAQLGQVVPVAGAPIKQGIERTLEGTAAAAAREAGGFGTAQEAGPAGASVQNALKAYATDKSQAASDYKEFDRLMHGAKPIQTPRTVKLLADLRGRFPTNEPLAGIFTNPKLIKLHDLLSPRVETIPAKTSGMLDQFGRPAVVTPAQSVMRGGQLTAPELKELRSQIGYLLETPQFGPEQIPRAQLRQLYASLTTDLQDGARARGPAAVKALNQATLNYGARMRVLDRLDSLINNPNADAVLARIDAATRSTSTSDGQLLQMAKKAMPQEEWGNLGASLLTKMGRPRPNVRDPLSVSPDFSLSSFATNWNTMSGRAKDLLFGADEVGSKRAGIERLARIVQSQKNVGKFTNVSQSGAMLTLRDIFTAGLTTGGLLAPAQTAAGMGAGWGIAKVMMSPQFTDMIYKLPMTSVRPGAGQLGVTRGVQGAQRQAVGDRRRPQDEVTAPAGVR